MRPNINLPEVVASCSSPELRTTHAQVIKSDKLLWNRSIRQQIKKRDRRIFSSPLLCALESHWAQAGNAGVRHV